MFYYSDWNVSYFSLPGCKCVKLEEWLKCQATNKNVEIKNIETDRYDWYSIITQPLYMRVETSHKCVLVCHPLERLYNIYNSLDDYKNPKYNSIPRDNFERFVKFLFMNRKIFVDEGQANNELTIFNNQLWMLSKRDNFINFEQVVKDRFDKSSIKELTDKLNVEKEDVDSLIKSFDCLTEDYMVHYTEEMIKMVYIMYFPDFNHFEFPLHKVPISFINYPITNTQPVFTIITPTVGTPSILRLKKALQYETVPFIHLILWDKARDKSAINPRDLEDGRTFCYEFMHPYFRFPNQRNDVWLRAVGITLTNTPYVTCFDDDTWPDRNHLEHILTYMNKEKLDYTYCKRRMWSKIGKNNSNNSNNKLELLGVDDFEATGEMTKMGYRLIDNSSLYMKVETARKVSSVFLKNQVYGDDRITPDFLDKNAKGKRMHRVLVNHVAKDHLVPFFSQGVTPEI